MYINQNRNTQNSKHDHLEMVKQIQINNLIHHDKNIIVLRQKTKKLIYQCGDDEGKNDFNQIVEILKHDEKLPM